MQLVRKMIGERWEGRKVRADAPEFIDIEPVLKDYGLGLVDGGDSDMTDGIVTVAMLCRVHLSK